MKTKQVKSVEQWRDELDQDSEGGRGRFMILSRELFNSRAFAALGGAGTIVVITILNKLSYEKKEKKDRKGVKINHPVLRNNGVFSLTINELVARGLSRSTATAARVLTWDLGFFDVLESGTIHHPGKYRYSGRWRLYPNGDYKPGGQQPPGKNVYPENGFKTRKDNQIGSTTESGQKMFPVYLKVVKS
jgi:hypothetical protein